jgi:hypothetical protein
MTTFNDYVALGKHILDRRNDSSAQDVNKGSNTYCLHVCHSNVNIRVYFSS